jgi:hypothetical protein
MNEENNFDIEAYFLADNFASQVYQWYKNQCLIGNATLLLAEKWGNRKHYVEKNFKELNVISEMIREGKKREALSWIDNVLSEEAKEQVTPDVYEYLQC